MWDRLKRKLQAAIITSNDTRLELNVRTVKGGKSTIFLGSWELVDNYRGDEFDFLLFDEVQDYSTFWIGWMEAMRPTLTPRQGSALFMGTPKGFNHLYDLFNLELTDPDHFKSFQFTSYDNPHIPIEEIEEAKQQLTEDRFNQEYLAKFTKTQGLVYKEFDRNKHLFDEMPEGSFEKVGGIDFGYVNPAAVLSIYVDGETLWVDDEWYKRGRTELQIAEYVAANNFNAVYPDPESPSAIRALEDAYQNVREVIKGRDSVKSGIQRVRELLKSKLLMINRRCLNLIHEFETYSYDEEKDDKNPNEKPVKANDHALDALRYVVMMRQPRGNEPTGVWKEQNFDTY